MHQNYFKELELQNKIWNLIKKNSFKIYKINEKNQTQNLQLKSLTKSKPSHRSWTTNPSLATFSSSTLIIFTIRGFPNICLVVFFIIVENTRICEILKQLNNLRLWWGLLICFEYEMGLLDLLSLFSFFLNYEFLIFYRVYFIYLIDKEKLHYMTFLIGPTNIGYRLMWHLLDTLVRALMEQLSIKMAHNFLKC